MKANGHAGRHRYTVQCNQPAPTDKIRMNVKLSRSSHPNWMAAFLSLIGLSILLSAPLAAQTPIPDTQTEFNAAWEPGTGDAWVDRYLIDINAYARRHPDAFIDELVRYGGAYRPSVQQLMQRDWQPGELWFACFWAQLIEVSCDKTIQLRQQYPELAWSERIEYLPVLPDRLHYRALRHALVASFDHWDRPIVLDAVLQRQLGSRTRRDTLARQQHK